MVILSEAEFAIISTENRLTFYSAGKLVFVSDMVLLIKHKVDWIFMRQKKQTQILKDIIHENIKTGDHTYKVGEKVMLNNHDAYKYETPFRGLFVIILCWNYGTVIL